MSNELVELRDQLLSYKYEHKILQKVPCSKEENEKYLKILEEGGCLPEGVYQYQERAYGDTVSLEEFYTILESDLTNEEIAQYLTFKKLKHLKAIKICTIIIAVFAGLGIFSYFLSLIGILGAYNYYY